MIVFRMFLVLLHIFLVCLGSPGTVSAESLSVPADDLKSGFNYHTPYRGQTFMFSEGVVADSLTVFVSPNIFQSFSFQLLLTEVDAANGIHPTTVLFESSPFDIPVAGEIALIPYTADLGGIPLAGGRRYAFILDIFESLSQIDTDLLWQYSTLTGMNADAVYSSGEHIYLEEDCTDSSTGLPCGSREDHFAATWIEEPAEDMGFVLEYEYAPVRKPSFIPAVIELLLRKK